MDSMSTGVPEVDPRCLESFERQGLMQLLGARLVEASDGHAAIEVPYRDDLTQQHGYFHGGVVTAIADVACGYAAYTTMPPDSSVLTVEFKINLMAAADGERAIAVGDVIRSGRTLTVCRIEAFVEKGGRRTHCATGTQTLMSIVGRAGVRG